MKNDNVYYLAQKQNKYNKYGKNINKKKKSVYFFTFLLVIFVIIAYNYLLNNRVVVVTADYKEIIDGFSTRGLIVRDEKTYNSTQAGDIQIYQTEGQRVAYGQPIVNINGVTIYNHQPGLVSYATDGLEDDLKPETISGITIDKFTEYRRNYKQLINNEYIKAGQAAFRIIDNNSFYLVVKTTAEEVGRYKNNELIFVKPESPGNRIYEANIIRKVTNDKEGLIFIKLDTFLKEWLNLRRAEFIFIKNIYRGISIPRKAIFTSTEGEGVLIVRSDGEYEFVELTIINGNEEFAIVKGIELGQKVITNPEDIDYGRGV
ncbi:MAG: HlyD family efflux transporter periplasmic adaptor subunit [Halanaerobiales bacterium]